MPATLYRSTDTGAPATGTTFADFTDLLHAILVTGYGSKPGAGWTREYYDAANSKVVFRNGTNAKARTYFRFANASTPFDVKGFRTMSSIDSGTNQMPDIVSRTIHSANSTPWWALADDRPAWLASVPSADAQPRRRVPSASTCPPAAGFTFNLE